MRRARRPDTFSGTMGDYYRISRSQTYSLLFALPLLVLYEVGAWMIAGQTRGMRNGADVLLRTLLAAGGMGGTLAFTALLICAGLVLIALEQRRKRVRIRGGYFAGMLAESVVYALLFGVVVGTLTRWLLGPGTRLAADGGAMTRLPLADQVVLSLGAGVYEELLFRVLLVGGLLALLVAIGLRRPTAGWAAAILAALLFSAFHYVGPYAYPLELQSFTFRFLAGLAFSGLYLVRGFGIAAWTHALYDVFLVLLSPGGG
jgi:hypothetical protein